MGITDLLKPRNSRKKKTAKEKTAAAPKDGKTYVVLDHPEEGEKITAPEYTFRIGADGGMEHVEVSVNRGPWQACRPSVGYWWYDWTGEKPGRYTVAARGLTKGGQTVKAKARRFRWN